MNNAITNLIPYPSISHYFMISNIPSSLAPNLSIVFLDMILRTCVRISIAIHLSFSNAYCNIRNFVSWSHRHQKNPRDLLAVL